MADAPTHRLVDFSEAEAKEVSEEIQAVLTKHQGMFNIKRLISEDGRFEAALQILKAEPIPKEEGVVSPIQVDQLENNGTNASEKTEEKPDAATA